MISTIKQFSAGCTKILIGGCAKQKNELINYHVTTEGPPVYTRARRLNPSKLAVARAEFSTMERLGIVRWSDSPWASPLHVVPKPNGGWRPCGD